MNNPYHRRHPANKPAGAHVGKTNGSDGDIPALGWKIATGVLAGIAALLLVGVVVMLIVMFVGHAQTGRVSASCDDGNPCTNDYLTGNEECEHRPVVNGVECSTPCYPNGICFNGECLGDCIGKCIETEDVPRLTGVNFTALDSWHPDGPFRSIAYFVRECLTGNALYSLWFASVDAANFTELGLDSYLRTIFGESSTYIENGSSSFWQYEIDRNWVFEPWHDVFSDICMSFIAEQSRSCLLATMNNIEIVQVGAFKFSFEIYCVYWYECHAPIDLYPNQFEYAMLSE